jgi:hypothetical protein
MPARWSFIANGLGAEVSIIASGAMGRSGGTMRTPNLAACDRPACWALATLLATGLLSGVSACSSGDKCVSSPWVAAKWGAQSTTMERCGGAGFPVMPTTPPSATVHDQPGIVMRVGQVLTLSKGRGWSGHSASGPVSDDPTILRVTQPSSGKTIGVYIAVKPGLAEVGAHGDVCSSVPQGCLFGTVQVLP